MDPGLEKIIDFLNRERIRATYAAVGEVLGLPPVTVEGMLGDRRPEVSWVVSSDTGLPTGYASNEMHPALVEKSEILGSGLQLLRMMAGIESRRMRD